MSGYSKHYKPRNAKNMSNVVFEQVRIRPRTGPDFTSANSNVEIDFYLPRRGYMQGVRSFLEAKCNITGGNLDQLQDCIVRQQIWLGNKLVIDEKQFNYKKRIEQSAYIKSDQEASATLQACGYKQGAAQTDSTDYYKRMMLAHPVYNAKSLFSEILPLRELPQIMIRYTLETDIDKFTGGDASAYSLSDVSLFLHLLDSPEIRANFKSITRSIETHHFVKLQESSATSLDHRLTGNYSNVKYILCCPRADADVSVGVTGNAHEFTSVFAKSGINDYYVEIDGQRIGNGVLPIKTENNLQVVQQLEQCFKPKDFCLGNQFDQTADNTLIYGVNLSAENRAISGKNLASSTGTISFKADTIAVSALTNFEYFLIYDKMIKIENGNVSVSN
jgi:hypothetical protein